jgi:hypothetical protein
MTEAKLMRERQTLQQLDRAQRREDMRRRNAVMAKDPEVYDRPLIPGGEYAPPPEEKRAIHESVKGRQRWHRLL